MTSFDRGAIHVGQIRRGGRWLATVAIVGLIAGCSGAGLTETAWTPGPAPAVPSAMGLSISNGTTMTITLVVNGAVVQAFVPGSGADPIPAGELPPLPWNVEVRTISGRVLEALAVRAGDVWQQGNEQKGVGARVDLSCGRLDVWSGPPMLGPAPGPGTPGDCAP
jgi:hypothetical protein